MTDPHGIARKTAKRLAPQFGEALPLTVEKIIHGAVSKPGQFDLGALGALAGIAQLIVQVGYILYELIYKRKLDKEALKRELRHELGLPQGVSEKQRDAVIDAAVAETKDEGEA